MDLKQDEMRDFIEEQFQILEKANDVVRDNAVKFHKDHCKDPSPICELDFAILFLAALDARARVEYTKK